jgi:cysteate synthase
VSARQSASKVQLIGGSFVPFSRSYLMVSLVNPSHYKLRCQYCGELSPDNGFLLQCLVPHSPALLTTEYRAKSFEPEESNAGISRYHNWLPVMRKIVGGGRTIIYESSRLGKITGLPKLWIAFSGYWPERDAWLETSSFKELEAWAVLSRIPSVCENVPVVASAGNTAAAFARVCSINRIACLIIIPESGLERLQFDEAIDPLVRIVSVTGFADYYDAIILADRISQLPGFYPEGGVKNVGRRDGIGTSLLSGIEAIGRLPDYYFQAVGSGTGGIAVHETAKRIVGDGRFGERLPQLILSQNLPFAPLYISWKSGSNELVSITDEDGRKQIEQIEAKVLSNRRPPYAVRGGVFDVLKESNGDMIAVDNMEAKYAGLLFEESEGIDIDPASAVSVASLIKAVTFGRIERDAVVLLHITGGGRKRRMRDKDVVKIKPNLEVKREDVLSSKALDSIRDLFR